MLMTLGLFVWNIHNASYEKLQRKNSWRYGKNNRVGQRPASQFLGPGDDTITLNGWIAPDITGQITSISVLRQMGDAGVPYVLVSGVGTIYGLWEITSLSETQTHFYPNGQPRKVEFSLTLQRVDDDKINRVPLVTNAQEVLV